MDSQSEDYTFYIEKIAPHYSDIYKHLMYTIRDKWLAKDITQITMEDAWKNIKKMRTYDNIKAVLITMANNNFSKHCSKEKQATVSLDEAKNVADTGKTVEEIVTAAETAAELKKMLKELEEKQSQVVYLYYFHDLPLNTIADITHENYNTVQSRHTRGLKKLRVIAAQKDKDTPDKRRQKDCEQKRKKN